MKRNPSHNGIVCFEMSILWYDEFYGNLLLLLTVCIMAMLKGLGPAMLDTE